MAKGAFGKFNDDKKFDESKEGGEKEYKEEYSKEAPELEEEKKDIAMKNITLAPESVDAIAASIVEKLGALQPEGAAPVSAEGGEGELGIV